MMTIVVVDDEDDIRELVREVLDGEGYETAGACNGQEALDLLRKEGLRPELILLDLMMPVMDGWDFLFGIDEDPELHSIPVALMSAHPSIRRAFEGRAGAGASTRLLLPKPIDVARLVAIVHEVCPRPTVS